jgi:hypothetical protein
MLRKIDSNIWVAEQPLKYWGLEVGTRMTVIRLITNELIVISPIHADDITIHQLNEIGNVAYIIAPNVFHHLFVSDFQRIFPKAQLWIPLGLDSKKPHLSAYKLISNDEGNILHEVEYLLFDGFKTLDVNGASVLNELVFFHIKSRTLILTDTAFHFDKSFGGTTKLVSKVLGIYGKLSPSLLEKLASTEKEKVKNSVQKILQWDFNRIIMAHGSIIEEDGKQKLKAGYEMFLGTSF